MNIVKTMTSKLGLAVLALTLASPSFAATPAKKVAPAAKAELKLPVDTAASNLKWVGKKVTGQHDGKISLKSGEFQVKGQELTGGTFEIDMNSITVEDIKDDKKANASLVGHLKNDDFFGVDKHPTTKIVIKKVTPLKKPEATKSHTVAADLTIKGKTLPVEFPALITVKGEAVQAKALVEVDRTKYDIKYKSGSFFKDLGDKVINDVFTVELDVKSKAPAKVAQN